MPHNRSRPFFPILRAVLVAAVLCATLPAWGDDGDIRNGKTSLTLRRNRVSSRRYNIIEPGELIVGIRLPPQSGPITPIPDLGPFLSAPTAASGLLWQALDRNGLLTRLFDPNLVGPNFDGPGYYYAQTYESFATTPHIFRVSGLKPEAIPLLRKDPNVLFVSNDPGVVNIQTPVGNQKGFMNPKQINLENPGDIPFTDVTGVTQKSLKGIDIKSTLAWRYSVGSPDVVVAIIDDSFDLTKPEFKDSIYTNTKEIPCNGKDDDNNGYIDDANGYNIARKTGCVKDLPTGTSHGTSMALTIAAPLRRLSPESIIGIAPNIRFLPIQLDEKFQEVDDALSYILEMKRSGVPIRVVNLSLGFPMGSNFFNLNQIDNSCDLVTPTKELTPLGKLLVSDMSVIAAAGNDGRDNDLFPICPATYAAVNPNVMTVAAVDPAGKHPFFSNFGKTSVTVSAPGSAVYTGYGYSTGTSIAAAHVSGIVALMYSIDPSLTAAQVKEIVMKSTKRPELKLPTATGGVLSAYIATTKVMQRLRARSAGAK
jgi:subtilisin family serine protease